MAEFPDEIGKLKSAFCDALVTWQEQAERMITELNKTFPGVTSEQIGEEAPSLHQASQLTVGVADIPLAVPYHIFNRKHATSSCVRHPSLQASPWHRP